MPRTAKDSLSAEAERKEKVLPTTGHQVDGEKRCMTAQILNAQRNQKQLGRKPVRFFRYKNAFRKELRNKGVAYRCISVLLLPNSMAGSLQIICVKLSQL